MTQSSFKRPRTSDSPSHSWLAGTNLSDQSSMLQLLENQLKSLPPSEDPSVLAIYWQLYCSYVTLSSIVDSVLPSAQAPDPEERQRKSIVVVSGLSESSSTVPSERVKHDHKSVTELLDSANVEVGFQSTLRLGVKSGDRPRLLKIFFSDPEGASKVLRTLTNHKRTSGSRLQFRHSLTREERQERKVLYDLCKAKREQAKAANNDYDYIVYAQQVMLRSEVDSFKANNPRIYGQPTGANRVPLGNARGIATGSNGARLTERDLPWLAKAKGTAMNPVNQPNFDGDTNKLN